MLIIMMTSMRHCVSVIYMNKTENNIAREKIIPKELFFNAEVATLLREKNSTPQAHSAEVSRKQTFACFSMNFFAFNEVES